MVEEDEVERHREYFDDDYDDHDDYILYCSQAEEMYDTNKDPEDSHNDLNYIGKFKLN